MVCFLLSVCPQLQAHDEIFEGRYYWGEGVDSFRLCSSATHYWTSYGFAGVKLRAFYTKNTTAPYEPVYLRFRGHVLNEEVDGFAAEYDGLIRISEILEVSTQIPEECGE